MITLQEVKEAEAAWAVARKNIRDAIAANTKARLLAEAHKTDENKAAYEATKKAHKATLDAIVPIRHNAKVLKFEYQTQQDSN
jgi:hypothetical protein